MVRRPPPETLTGLSDGYHVEAGYVHPITTWVLTDVASLDVAGWCVAEWPAAPRNTVSEVELQAMGDEARRA